MKTLSKYISESKNKFDDLNKTINDIVSKSIDKIDAMVAKRREKIENGYYNGRSIDPEEPVILMKESNDSYSWSRFKVLHWKTYDECKKYRNEPVGIFYNNGQFLRFSDPKVYDEIYAAMEKYFSNEK